MILACGILSQAKIYVLCVGVADYPGEKRDLKLCANDARTMRDLYEKNGKAETMLMTDERAMVDNIISGLKAMSRKATKDDVLVFFFSGHGSAGTFSCYDRHLWYEEITNVMEKSKAQCKMIMADACYSGNARKEKTGKGGKKKDGSVMFFLSSRSEETSAEYKDYWKNGIFTAFLERGLRGAADADRNKVITARELYLYVNRSVSKLRNEKQHPVMWGKFDNDMPIMSWK